MSGNLIGGVIGAAIGFFTPVGPAVGWALGSAVGGYVDPTKIDGPRLNDTSVQISTYGAAIAQLWGGVAVAGNVIWATNLVEHDAESGGKGGPVTTNHTYSVSMAVLIGKGEIKGLRRIWADAKLVYDISDTSNGAGLAASALFARYFTFYQGTADQLPDPTMEAALGAGNVSAYRGYSYIVFTDLPLADYGNRIPNLRFETSFEAAPVTPGTGTTYEPLKIYPWVVGANGPEHSVPGYTQFSGYGAYFDNFEAARASLAASPNADSTAPYATNYVAYCTPKNHRWNVFPDGAVVGESDDAFRCYLVASYDTKYKVVPAGGVGFLECTPLQLAGATPDDGIRYWTGDSSTVDSTSYNTGGIAHLVSTHPGVSDGPQYKFKNNCANYPDDSNGYFPRALISPLLGVDAERLPAPPPPKTGCVLGDPCTLGSAQVPGQPDFCIDCAGNVTPNLTISYEVISATDPSTFNGQFHQLAVIAYDGQVLVQNALGPVTLPGDPHHNDPDFWAAAYDEAIANGTLDPAHAAPRGTPYGVNQVAKGTVSSVAVDNAEEGGTTLDVIVTDVCRLAGMPDHTFDVTALVGIPVMGYSVARQMPARQALLQLQQVFWWDFVESGRVIKAVRRGAAPALTIGLDDLGASDSTDPPVAVVPTRGQEAELPATVTVAYPVRATGYQTGTQYARRVTTGSKQTQSNEVTVVMLDQLAAEVADVLMYVAWSQRSQRVWTTTRKYARSEPTDVVMLDDGEFVYTVLITDRSEEDGIITWTGVDERPAAYSPNVAPGNAAGAGTVGGVRFDGPTKLELIDSPLLRDEDDGPGLYAAAAGYTGTWRGGSAFESLDGGTTFTRVRDLTRQATLGYAQTVLGDFTGGNVVDEANSVTIRLHSGSLASITQAQLLNEGNAAILGDEIFQFKRATLVATGVYKLSGLLRGRRGTEQHLSGHAMGERFVLLSAANVYRLAVPLTDIGVPAQWRAPSSGQALDTALEIDFTNTGAGLKPLSPVHLAAVASAEGSGLVASWVRRTRIGGAWRDGSDVPLGEATEAYDVELRDAGGQLLDAKTVTEPGAQLSGEVALSITLSEPVDRVHACGGAWIGVFDEYPTSNTVNSVVALSPADGSKIDGYGLSPASTATGVQMVEVVGTDIYVAFNRGTDAAQISRIDSTAHPWSAAATRTGSGADSIHGIAFDGADLWVTDGGNLLQLNRATLDVVSTTALNIGIALRAMRYDAGTLWIAASADSGTTILEVDIATLGVRQTISSTLNNPEDLRVVDELVFLAGTTEIVVFDKATGAQVARMPGGDDVGMRNGLAVLPGYVLAADVPNQRLLYLSRSDGSLMRTRPVPNLRGVAGEAGDAFFVAVRPADASSTSRAMSTSVFSTSSAAGAGATVTVWQRSAAVGRGFPASLTLE